MRVESPLYKGLTVHLGDEAVRFVDGVAEVDEGQASALRALDPSFGLVVPDPPKRGRPPKQAE